MIYFFIFVINLFLSSPSFAEGKCSTDKNSRAFYKCMHICNTIQDYSLKASCTATCYADNLLPM